MFDFASLFISHALAADVAAPVVATTTAGETSQLMRFLPLFLIFGVFYIFLIRPQQKKVQLHDELIKGLKKGDKIVTAGGIVGSITKIDGERYLMVEIAKGVEIKVVKATVSDLPADNAVSNQNKSK